MRRLWVVALSIVLCSVFGYYYGARLRAAEVGEFDNFTSWSPDAATLYRQVANIPMQAAIGNTDQQRKRLIGDLLTKRFRGHDPKIAVRVKFERDRTHPMGFIKLMCPARMEPWNMDWLAVNTWREVKNNFGTPYDLDIYITYIGLRQIKVAELRSVPGQPEKVAIRYRPLHEVRQAINADETTILHTSNVSR